MDPHFDGVIFQTDANELHRRIGREFPPFLVLDVRDSADFASAHIPGAVSVSPSDIDGGLPRGAELGTEFFVVGSGPGDDGVRAASLALMENAARRIVELRGGMSEWSSYGYPTDSDSKS